MELKKLVNLKPHGYSVNLRDPETGLEVSKILPATVYSRKGPATTWHTVEGVLLVDVKELSNHVALLQAQGALKVEKVATAPAAKVKASLPLPPPPSSGDGEGQATPSSEAGTETHQRPRRR